MTQPAHIPTHHLTPGPAAAQTEPTGGSPGRGAAHRMFGRRADQARKTAGQLPPAPAAGPRRGRLHRQPSEAPDSAPAGGADAPLAALREAWDEIRREVEQHAQAEETRRSYAQHQRAWRRWCAVQRIDPEAPTGDDVAAHLASYLVEVGEDGYAVRTDTGALVAAVAAVSVRQRLAAIDSLLEASGRRRLGREPVVKTFMEGMRRLYGVAPVHAKAPVLLADLRRMVALTRTRSSTVSRDLVLTRLHDRHGATPGQLARLDWPGVDLAGVDAYVTLPPSRRGHPPTRHRVRATGAPACPVAALRLLHSVSDGAGPVLTGVGGQRLTRQAIDKRLRALSTRRSAARPVKEANKSLRDAALLTCGWFAALRRSNLVWLRWSEVTWHPNGDIRIFLRRSKTDQHGNGEWNWLPNLDGDVACPVVALTAWRDRMAEIVGGDPAVVCPQAPVFPAMGRHDEVKVRENGSLKPLTGAAVNELIQVLAVRTGLTRVPGDDERNPFGGHSLRAGFVTQGVLNNVQPLRIAAVTHHRDLRSLKTYAKIHDTEQADTIRQIVHAQRAS